MTRIHGLDLARALAIKGMMAAHIGPAHVVTDGYPSVLFAVLAGVSMGIMTSRSALVDPRFALLTRAVILIGVGVVLDALQAGIVVVLIAIGVSWILLLPVLAWRIRRQVLLLGGLVVLGPLVGAAYEVAPLGFSSEFFTDLFFGPYPLTAWLAYTLLGLLIHRLMLAREVWLLGGGVLAFVLAQGVIQVTGFRVGPHDELNLGGTWLQGEPHTGGLLDVLTSAGVAVAVIGVCLLAGRVAAVVWVSYPLRSFGAMSLTIYVTHVIITTLANGTFVGADGSAGSGAPVDVGWTMYVPGGPVADTDPFLPPELFPSDPVVGDPLWPDLFLWQLLGFLVFASLWRWRFRRGPGEWAMRRAVDTASSPANR